jgi:glutamate synthase (NADPH/NADH) large chain
VPENPYGQTNYCSRPQDHGLERALDQQLIALSEAALVDGQPVEISMPIRNVNRTVGTMLGSEVTKRFGAQGLPNDTIRITLTGSAGQSFGAFVPRGLSLRLEGDANDYLAKGLSGGRVTVLPPPGSRFVAEDNIIAGNVILYGATAGEVFIRGMVGERFCVRNSGATAVVEGVGDHACEYMTGGRAVILGRTGRNFAAGMSGGLAFVYDSDGSLWQRTNRDMVDLDGLEEDDRTWLREIVSRHLEETGSAVAERILSAWWRESDRFRKVFPKDFKRVLAARADAEERGTDPDEAVMAAARG